MAGQKVMVCGSMTKINSFKKTNNLVAYKNPTPPYSASLIAKTQTEKQNIQQKIN